MAVIRKLISWWRLMSWKSMETGVLARVRWVGNRSKSVFADLLPSGRASYEGNLSWNIYAFLKFTLQFAFTPLSFYRLRKRIRKKHRNLILEYRELRNYPKLECDARITTSRQCKFMAKTLSYELSQVSEFNKFRVSIEFPRVSNCSFSNF